MDRVPYFRMEGRKNKIMAEINIGKRTIPLFYSTYEMIAIQKEIGCTAYQLKDEVFGLHYEDEENQENLRMDIVDVPEKMEKLGKLICILGNAGLEEAGEKADLTEKWVLRNMRPAMIIVYAVAIMAVIAEGNQMEAPTKEETGPVDELLEEQNAKKQPGK